MIWIVPRLVESKALAFESKAFLVELETLAIKFKAIFLQEALPLLVLFRNFSGLTRGIAGVHHWTDAGVASWYDFSVTIQDEAQEFGLLQHPVPIRPIRSRDYPTRARRPAFSVLDKTRTWRALGSEPVHWRRALRIMLAELAPAADQR